MSVVNLELFKKHVRVDFDEDDEYLSHLLEVAETAVVNATNREAVELSRMGGGTLPSPIQHAVMMLAGHWYNQRESVSTVQMHAVPDSLQALIRPYRKLGKDASGTNENQD